MYKEGLIEIHPELQGWRCCIWVPVVAQIKAPKKYFFPTQYVHIIGVFMLISFRCVSSVPDAAFPMASTKS